MKSIVAKKFGNHKELAPRQPGRGRILPRNAEHLLGQQREPPRNAPDQRSALKGVRYRAAP